MFSDLIEGIVTVNFGKVLSKNNWNIFKFHNQALDFVTEILAPNDLELTEASKASFRLDHFRQRYWLDLRVGRIIRQKVGTESLAILLNHDVHHTYDQV